jgi:hypothetical protein
MPDLEDIGRMVEESLAELLEAARGRAKSAARSDGAKKASAKPARKARAGKASAEPSPAES